MCMSCLHVVVVPLYSYFLFHVRGGSVVAVTRTTSPLPPFVHHHIFIILFLHFRQQEEKAIARFFFFDGNGPRLVAAVQTSDVVCVHVLRVLFLIPREKKWASIMPKAIHCGFFSFFFFFFASYYLLGWQKKSRVRRYTDTHTHALAFAQYPLPPPPPDCLFVGGSV